MKNEKIILAFGKMSPSEKQKEKMLANVLKQKPKKSLMQKKVWRYGMATLCLCCFITTKSILKEELPPVHEPRVLMEEPNSFEFCYRDVCYQEIGVANFSDSYTFLETVFESGQTINVYQGEWEDEIILEFEDSYFLYQKIDR